jgi:Zn-dependent protease with chaperone function
MMPLIVMLMPLFLRPMLGAGSLPHGPLRQRLEAQLRRFGIRYTDILLWNTQGHIANAMVVGLVPWIRYLIFTDRLLSDLSEAEVDAVLGHEIGHIYHHHIPYYLVFLMLSTSLLGGLFIMVSELFPTETREWGELSLVLPVFILCVYLFLVFGYLSRRCERQADLFGCRAVSCHDPQCTHHEPEMMSDKVPETCCPTGIRIFIGALERVGFINGMIHVASKPPTSLRECLGASLRKVFQTFREWQHSTIPKRVGYLQQIIADPPIESHFQRRLFWIRTAVILILVGGLLLLSLHPSTHFKLL